MKVCILFGLRSGSHWLADILGKNGIYPGYETLYQMLPRGRGEGKFNFPLTLYDLQSWRDVKGAVETVFNQYAKDGKMSFNISRGWVRVVLQHFAIPVNQFSIAIFIHHVFSDYRKIGLLRKNQIAQCVSGLFAVAVGSQVQDHETDIDLPYDFWTIQQHYDEKFANHFAGFDDVLPYLKCDHTLFYEDLFHHPQETIDIISKTIGYPLSYDGETPRFNVGQKQFLANSFFEDMLRRMYELQDYPSDVRKCLYDFQSDA